MPTEIRPDEPPPGAAPGTAASLAEWLRARSDAQLVELLTLRPDLAVAPPGSTKLLAGRAQRRMSVQRVAGDLDTAAMMVLAVLVQANADAPESTGLPPAGISATLSGGALGGGAGGASAVDSAVEDAVDRLQRRGLVWDASPGGPLRTVPAAREILPWPAEIIVGPGASSDDQAEASTEAAETPAEADLSHRIAALDDTTRSLLGTLASGGGLGRTRDAAEGTPADRPVQRLLASGLAVKVDESTIRLPENVRTAAGAALLAEPITLLEPVPDRTTHPADEVDGAAATEASELLRHAGAIIASFGARPVPELRGGSAGGGGVGVRELARITKELDLELSRVAFLLEVLAQADLIRSGIPQNHGGRDPAHAVWAPAEGVDAWLAQPPAYRWAVLARAWLTMPRRAWAVGQRDHAGKAVPALAADLNAPSAAVDRTLLLQRLAGEDPGTAIGIDDLLAALRWQHPRRHAHLPAAVLGHLAAEARSMGVLAYGALSGPGRALLDRDGDPAAAMATAMPDPVDHVLLQADLTMIAPGPLEPELEEKVGRVAVVESAGAATVYRITEGSLRGAFDSGMSRTELHELFAGASRTPIPQALTYLIDDVARRHGQLRVGFASSFVRCEDPALLSEVLTRLPDLGLRRIAPTVAVGSLELMDLLDALDETGVPAVGEDRHGALVDLRPRGARIATPHRVRRNTYHPEPAEPSAEALNQAVAGMRAGDRAEQTAAGASGTVRTDGTRASGAAAVSLLQTAVRTGRSISVGYVDAQGKGVTLVVRPISFTGGTLEAVDPATGAPHAFSLHRITSVSLVD